MQPSLSATLGCVCLLDQITAASQQPSSCYWSAAPSSLMCGCRATRACDARIFLPLSSTPTTARYASKRRAAMEPLTKGPVCCITVTAARTHLNTWSQSPSSASQSLYSPSLKEGTTYGSVGVIPPAAVQFHAEGHSSRPCRSAFTGIRGSQQSGQLQQETLR